MAALSTRQLSVHNGRTGCPKHHRSLSSGAWPSPYVSLLHVDRKKLLSLRVLAPCALSVAVCSVLTGKRLPKQRHRKLQVMAAAQAEDALQTLQPEGEAKSPQQPLAELLRLAAATDRGQRLTKKLRQQSEDLLSRVEAQNPTRAPALSPLLEGTWRLVFASEDVTRSSPFFWAARQLGLTDPTPFSRSVLGSDSLLETTFAITDNIPLTYMGIASQQLSRGSLVNQVNVGVFITGESEMTTTCSYTPDPVEDDTLLVKVLKTQVLGTSMAASVLKGIDFPSGEWFEGALGEEGATVKMRTTYLDESVRIVRDARRAESCFVYVRSD
eukprot:TRINITY_DN68199_c0_g1_i1.p1 TRINITY_DN68199_c0_g1~~TRINITY_DN68199_c0_g1_i1.p1  ORF type:complete len:339 (+),score=52.95 TRINITY_DN68199_c0_g1_i1:38-1018(+)